MNQLEHRGIQVLIRDLNFLYRFTLGLHKHEFTQEGFEWLDSHDVNHSIMAYLRRGDDNRPIVIVLNFSAVARLGYRVGVPALGIYRQLLNSDHLAYGGISVNGNEVFADPIIHMGYPYSLLLDLPPLTGIVIALLE